MFPSTRMCLYCNTRLTFHQAQTGRFCDDPQCRWKYARIPTSQLCTVCARPLSPRDLAAQACDNAECRQALIAEKRKREDAERAILIEQAKQLRDRQAEVGRDLRDQRAEAVGIKKPGTYPLVVIPSFSAPVTNVPERRRRALRDHLTQLISQATVGRGVPSPAAPPQPATPASALQTVIGRACAQCQGSCCRCGGNVAYLAVETIRRFMDAHPDLRPRDVLAAYLDRVSNKTYQNSCIYHSTSGCGLTADMRSDTCNLFFCDGLREFQRDFADTNQIRVFIASESDGAIRSAAFVDEVETRVVAIRSHRL